MVTNSYTPQDQSIPSNISASLTRRDGTKPTVRGLTLGTSFASAPKTSVVSHDYMLLVLTFGTALQDLSTLPFVQPMYLEQTEILPSAHRNKGEAIVESSIEDLGPSSKALLAVCELAFEVLIFRLISMMLYRYSLLE